MDGKDDSRPASSSPIKDTLGKNSGQVTNNDRYFTIGVLVTNLERLLETFPKTVNAIQQSILNRKKQDVIVFIEELEVKRESLKFLSDKLKNIAGEIHTADTRLLITAKYRELSKKLLKYASLYQKALQSTRESKSEIKSATIKLLTETAAVSVELKYAK